MRIRYNLHWAWDKPMGWMFFAFRGSSFAQHLLLYYHRTQVYVATKKCQNIPAGYAIIGMYDLAVIEQMQRENPEYTWQIIK